MVCTSYSFISFALLFCFIKVPNQFIYVALLPADLMLFFFACSIFVLGLSDGWTGSGAPIFPMTGRVDRVVQLLVHGSRYPISSPGGLPERLRFET